MKRVIFVGGANHSSSTMIGAILGASMTHPFESFHVGEIKSFFDPRSPKYGQPKAVLESAFGDFWSSVDYKVGYDNAYDELFKKSAETDVLVDSSKTWRCLQRQVTKSDSSAWRLTCLISYRRFEKIWKSDERRGVPLDKRLNNLKQYERLLSVIDEHHVSYKVFDLGEFLKSPKLYAKKVCEVLGVSYFDGKEEYWRYPDAHLYGAATQRRHFRNPSEAGFLVNSRPDLSESQGSQLWQEDEGLVAVEARLISESI
ncbi:hypothetical protein [Gilvimarinus agarilyticus]|uniref:hypothetical protein n=1 Tax=Gilvimarinus agarilyticus TaxID=679259 RepID=UPI0005A282D7|nr:hypothetical protein [Gilvimarinus agarilyticus]